MLAKLAFAENLHQLAIPLEMLYNYVKLLTQLTLHANTSIKGRPVQATKGSIRTVLASIRVGKDYSDWQINLNGKTYLIVRNRKEVEAFEVTLNGDYLLAQGLTQVSKWLQKNNLELSEALK